MNPEESTEKTGAQRRIEEIAERLKARKIESWMSDEEARNRIHYGMMEIVHLRDELKESAQSQ